ncbi:MAG: hypothetical protein IJG33_04145 [Selenomonadaceae bacterium]|nr:hypothetical protein [Selenomonadaceae bacterium]
MDNERHKNFLENDTEVTDSVGGGIVNALYAKQNRLRFFRSEYIPAPMHGALNAAHWNGTGRCGFC